MGAERLIVAKRFQLPGGGESVPGEEIAASSLGSPRNVERLLRVGYLLGYDAEGKPVKESADFVAARRLAPEPTGAAPPAREFDSRPGFRGVEPRAESEEPGGAVTADEEPVSEPAPEPEEGPKPKRRRRKSSSKKG